MIALLLLALLGVPVCLVLICVALVSDRKAHRVPAATRYSGRVWVPGYRTKKGRYRSGHYKRR